MRFDHVVLAVADLDVSAARLEAGHGLVSVPGGRHPRWGTGNRIVPMGEDYLELISVLDPGVARTTALGWRVLDLTADGQDRWFSICVADDDIEATAERLGVTVEAGRRTLPDGTEVRWRAAATEDDARDPSLPFFITWEVPAELHPGRAGPPGVATGIAWAEVAGDPDNLRTWLNGVALPIRVVEGDPAVRAIGLRGRDGSEIVVRTDL